MPDNGETAETAPAGGGRSLFRRKAKASEPGEPGEPGVEPDPPAAAPARAKRRRQMPDSTKRILVVIAGVFALVASVLGFYYTSDAFDERLPVLVAARDIAAGETVSSADLGSDLVLVGSIPHISWTADGPFMFEGMVAVQPIAAGALVLHDMFIAAETAPVGVELEVIVPLDLSLATGEVFDGDLVLLVDSGAEPVAGDEGRPRQVVRQFELANFDGSQMRLFLAPEQWAEWEALLADVGGRLMVVDLGIGADAEETAQRLDAVWHAQWAASAEEVAQAAAAAEPVAGPGELEVIVSLDAGLVPSGVADGDLVLLIDPGRAPDGAHTGRPRKVLQTLLLEDFANGQMRMFVPPDEWVRWRALPERLGGVPLVLPVADGTDVEEMIERLDAEWDAAWQNAIIEAAAS